MEVSSDSAALASIFTKIADSQEKLAVQKQEAKLKQAKEAEKAIIEAEIALIKEKAREEKAAKQSEGQGYTITKSQNFESILELIASERRGSLEVFSI